LRIDGLEDLSGFPVAALGGGHARPQTRIRNPWTPIPKPEIPIPTPETVYRLDKDMEAMMGRMQRHKAWLRFGIGVCRLGFGESGFFGDSGFEIPSHQFRKPKHETKAGWTRTWRPRTGCPHAEERAALAACRSPTSSRCARFTLTVCRLDKDMEAMIGRMQRIHKPQTLKPSPQTPIPNLQSRKPERCAGWTVNLAFGLPLEYVLRTLRRRANLAHRVQAGQGYGGDDWSDAARQSLVTFRDWGLEIGVWGFGFLWGLGVRNSQPLILKPRNHRRVGWTRIWRR